MKRGVNVYGYVLAESGMGELTRSIVAALRACGVEYAVIPTTATESRQESGFTDFGSVDAQFDINIVGVNADSLPLFVDSFGYSALNERYTIGVWAWEIEDFPQWMARSADLVDEVWGISSHTSIAIQRQIDKPVAVFTLPVRSPRQVNYSRADVGLPAGFTFLFTFDFDSVFRRKNPTAVVTAFRRAFPDHGDAYLVLKSINGVRHADHLAELRSSAADREDIIILDAYVNSDKQAAIMQLSDAYVSLHRCEGFGMTMAEAMAAGKPVIATGYSGNMDFMNEFNSFLVPFRLEKVGEGSYPYPAAARWAEPDIEEAARLMKLVRDRTPESITRAERARADMLRYHSAEARTEFMLERLNYGRAELSRRHGTSVNQLKERRPLRMSKNETCTYSRKPQVDVSRIEEIIRNGPNVDAPSAVPLVMPWLRRVVMRLIRNFFVYQQQVNNELVVALKHLSVGSLRPMDSIGGTADLSDQYSDQLLNSAKIAESTARECEERFGEPAEDVARTLRLLAARLRGLSH